MCKRIEFFLDSESLIKWITKMLEYIDYYSSATMQADWDVLQAIVHIIKTFTFPLIVRHVMEHQDNKKSYSELDPEAQLKDDAYKLAGIAETMGRRHHKPHQGTNENRPNSK